MPWLKLLPLWIPPGLGLSEAPVKVNLFDRSLLMIGEGCIGSQESP